MLSLYEIHCTVNHTLGTFTGVAVLIPECQTAEQAALALDGFQRLLQNGGSFVLSTVGGEYVFPPAVVANSVIFTELKKKTQTESG
jgi:hypothetical protein